MKKRLRFQLPYVPLKDLRGEQDEEDIQDKYHARFVPPTTTTENEEANGSTDGYSNRSSLPVDGIGNVSDEGMERYLGRDSRINSSVSQISVLLNEMRKDIQRNSAGDQSMSHEAIEMQVFEQVQLPPDTDSDDDGDDGGPLTDTISHVSNALSTDDTSSYNSKKGSEMYQGSNIGSIESINRSDNTDNASRGEVNNGAAQFDNASEEEARRLDNDDIDDNTGYQTAGSIGEEAIQLQTLADVQQPPNADTDVSQ